MRKRTAGQWVWLALLWTATVAGGGAMILVGSAKLRGASPWPAMFDEFGYPTWMRILVGMAQVGGGITLMIPRVARVGAAILTLVMTGAVVTELTRPGGFPSPIPALVYTLIFLVILIARIRERKSVAATDAAHAQS